MNNLSKIKRFSKNVHLFFTFLLPIIPLVYILFWAFINHLPETLITVSHPSSALIQHELPWELRLAGIAASLLPLSAIIYGLFHLRRLFAFYEKGVIFSFEHVGLFKKISRALLLWVIFSIIYESAESVIFSFGNPPGSRVLEIGIDSGDITTLVVGLMVLVIAWVMDEGRILAEERELTV